MSTFLFNLGRRCARHPFRTLGVWLLVAVAVLGLHSRFGDELVDDFKVPGVESQEANDVLSQRFPAFAGTSGRIVFHVEEGRIDDPGPRAEIAAATSRLAEGEDVSIVTDPFDPAATTTSADGRTAFTTVQYTEQTLDKAHYDEALDAIESMRDAGVQAEISGSIAQYGEEIAGQEGIGLAVALVVLLLAFGSVIAAGIPIATALLGVMVGMLGVGVLAGFTNVPTTSEMLAVMVGLGVGIDYALFIVTRHRQHLHEGMSVEDAAGHANATAGQSVLFAGCTVVIAICGLLLAGVPAVTAMGFSIGIVVIFSMALAVTALPAFLGLAGTRIDTWAIHRKKAHDESHRTISGRWAHHVGRRPWRYAILSLVGLLAITAPVLALNTGFADDSTAAETTTQRKAFDLLTESYGAGFNTPLTMVVELPEAGDTATIERLTSALSTNDGIVGISEPVLSEAGDTAVLIATPATAPQDKETSHLLHELRSDVLPAAMEGTGGRALITGTTAFYEDATQRITERLPIFIAGVVALSFLLLMIVFRSVFVPLKAAIMNLLSIGAAYGVVVAVFQWGWAKGLVGLQDTVPVNPFVPLIMFAILFGLSMDYEVFLLSRVREEYQKTGDSHRSVVDGLGSTARVITSAALIMISVFLAFVPSDNVTVKMFGLGLAVAVFLDATIVRMVLVPSTMALLGKANWWLPRWLDRMLPHLDLEGGPAPAPAPELVETEAEPVEEPLAA
jgi:RND superfamily putative drug exporter